MLKKRYRLQKKDIREIFKLAKSFETNSFSLRLKENHLGYFRFSVIVPLALSKKSTKRNRPRRQLREIIQNILRKIENGFDVLLIAKKSGFGKNYWKLKEEVERLFAKAKILKNQNN